MSMENTEALANQVTMEITRKGIEVTGALTRGTWNEIRTMLGAVIREVRGGGEKKQQVVGGKVTTQRLEEISRGERDSVNLEDARISRRVERQLKKYGVTYSVTREGSSRRVHIGAGNAAQLDQAMQRAEGTLARSIERSESRAKTMKKVRSALTDRIAALPPRRHAPDTGRMPDLNRGGRSR